MPSHASQQKSATNTDVANDTGYEQMPLEEWMYMTSMEYAGSGRVTQTPQLQRPSTDRIRAEGAPPTTRRKQGISAIKSRRTTNTVDTNSLYTKSIRLAKTVIKQGSCDSLQVCSRAVIERKSTIAHSKTSQDDVRTMAFMAFNYAILPGTPPTARRKHRGPMMSTSSINPI